MASSAPLTLEGLNEILYRQMEATAARFREVHDEIQSLAREVHSLVGQVDALLGLLRDQGLRMIALAEQVAEQQTQIRQILQRLEQHDGRFEQHARHLEQHDRESQEFRRRSEAHDGYIRRILDLLERRGGDGGPSRA